MEDYFGAAIRRFRLRARLTQEALAERSSVPVSTIHGMETGTRRNPQLASVRRLADALELRPAEQDELLAAAAGSAEPAAIPAPRRLPASPARIVGRHEELDRLDATLPSGSGASSTVVISAIAGAGGVGKSWRVLHWAHRNADRFPDRQLFVDLRGFSLDSDPMESAVAVRGFLDALGVEPVRIPVPPHAQAALFRSLMADKRMLLVLDNAAYSAQVTPAAGRRHPDRGGAAWSRSRGAKMRARIESAGSGPGCAHSGGWHRITTMVQAVLVLHHASA